VKRLGGLLLLLVLLIPAATAATTVSINPETIQSGDTVTVNIKDLPDGSVFSLRIRGEFGVTPGEVFTFTAREISLPFNLTSAEVNAYTKGTNRTELEVALPDGGSYIARKNATGETDEILFSQPRDRIPSGTINVVTLRGDAAADSIIADLTVLGTKQGSNDGTVSFTVEGASQGTATVVVNVDGRPAPTPTSMPTATTTQNGGGNGGGSTGPTATSTAATRATVTSADGKASLTGTDVAGAEVLIRAVQGTLPTGWATAGRAYAVTPANRAFDPTATLSLRLPSAETTATLARYENGAWTPVPSKVEGDRISASVARGGSYVLLVAASAPEPTATTVTTSTPAATSTTVSVTTTPAAAPVAPLLPVIAFAILMLDWKRRG